MPGASGGGMAGRAALAILFSSLALSAARAADAVTLSDLGQMSIEELARVKVTSVSKTPQALGEAAAAIFVITQEDIRRSGAGSVPEVLRLAPNLQVARLDANTYAISARGFNQSSGTANKLLVLIDGRAVYSPLFSGTFWDAQNLVLGDIDRIEVISGPGGTLWGANAVNGVINIITKSSEQTDGLLLDVRGGSLDQSVTARIGGRLGEHTTFRVYGMGFVRGAMATLGGLDAKDSWHDLQGGFRGDWSDAQNVVTLEGDIYRGTSIGKPAFLPEGSNAGGNLSAIWNRQLADGSAFRVQAYYDNSWRELVSGIVAHVDQYAFDAQYSFEPWEHHDVVIGGGYRGTNDRLKPGPHTVFLAPAARALGYGNFFVQDAIALDDRLKLTLGVKLENNTYTGTEFMPDARLAWNVTDRSLLWASVSRAVRTPSRFDTDLINPGLLAGGPDFQSEDLIAYQAGYRGLLTASLSLSVSAYYNVYDDLRTVEASTPVIFPLVIRNGMEGDTYGAEMWGDYSISDWWRLSAGVSVLQKNLRLAPGSRDVFGVGFAGNDPDYEFQLRSNMDLPHGLQLNVWLRNVASLPSPAIPSYFEADARLAWHPVDAVELSLDGQNLLHARHLEFINPSIPGEEVPRSITLSARWEF